MPTTLKRVLYVAIGYVEKTLQGINPRRVVVVLIGLGIVLRLAQYLYNRSLWLDELCLALNLTERSFSELLDPLDYHQHAPPGFLFVEKILVNLLGSGEHVLRLFPLIAGIFSLFIFYAIARRVLNQPGIIVALGLFAFAGPLIRYSSELKQYSSDVAIVLCIYLMGLMWFERESRFILYTFIFSILGALLIWFAHPSIFVLAGVGISLVLHSVNTKKWKQVAWFSIPAIFWLSSFASFYYVSLLEISQTKRFLRLVGGFESSYMPMPPLSINDLMWFPMKFFEVFRWPGGLTLVGVAAVCFIIGSITKFLEDRHSFNLLLWPLIITVAASAFHKYPFGGRLILFIVSPIMLFVGEGVDQILHRTKSTYPLIGFLLCILLFFHPVCKAALQLWNPIEREEVKPVLNYVKHHIQKGDVLYLHHGSQAAFKYYANRYGLEGVQFLNGVKDRSTRKNIVDDLKRLPKNKRTWVLFTHIYNKNVIDEQSFFLFVLDDMGKQVDSFNQKGASVYLYDLQQGANQ